jgi:hypothetical protein
MNKSLRAIRRKYKIIDHFRHSKFEKGTRAEKLVAEHLTSKGIYYLRNGWPDFLIHKRGEYALIEVKGKRDKLRSNQVSMHMVLKELGLKVITVHTDKTGWQESLEEAVR